MVNTQPSPIDLERKILEVILAFPDRIDEMETRNEDNCRVLAARIARLVQAETGGRPGKR